MLVLAHSIIIIFSFFYDLQNVNFMVFLAMSHVKPPILNVTLMAISDVTKWTFANKTISLRSIFIRCRHINIIVVFMWCWWFGGFLFEGAIFHCVCSSASFTIHGLNIICYTIAHIFMLLSIRFRYSHYTILYMCVPAACGA